MAKNTYLPLKDFVKSGLLQEANRQFFHPLGMALVVDVTTKEVLKLKGILISEDLEGIALEEVNAQKAANVAHLANERRKARKRAFGFVVQPVPPVKKEDLAVGKIFRGKNPKALREGVFNDRVIIWMGKTTLKYDANDLQVGSVYPEVKITNFLQWAGFEVRE